MTHNVTLYEHFHLVLLHIFLLICKRWHFSIYCPSIHRAALYIGNWLLYIPYLYYIKFCNLSLFLAKDCLKTNIINSPYILPSHTTAHYSYVALSFTTFFNILVVLFCIIVQGDWKRLSHFVSLYGLNSKRRLNTRQTVGCGIPSSLLALQVDLRWLRSKLSWIRLTFSSDRRGRPELLPLHRLPICSNWWFQRQMLFLVGGWMLKQRRNVRCTVVADSVLTKSRTQKILCCIAAILLSTNATARLCGRRAL